MDAADMETAIGHNLIYHGFLETGLAQNFVNSVGEGWQRSGSRGNILWPECLAAQFLGGLYQYYGND